MELRPEYAKTRILICRACKEYNHFTKTCDVCYCFMPGKTLLKGASCPIGKWKAIEDDKTP